MARRPHTLILAGKEFVVAYMVARKKPVVVRGKRYISYEMHLPISVARRLIRGNYDKVPVLGLLTIPDLDLIRDYDGVPEYVLRNTDPAVLKKLKVFGVLPGGEEDYVLIAAKREEVEGLGLDPAVPLTLEDVLEAVNKNQPEK